MCILAKEGVYQLAACHTRSSGALVFTTTRAPTATAAATRTSERQHQLGFTLKGNILWVLYWRMSCFLYWRVRSVGFYIKGLNVKPVKTSNANFNSILKRLLERALAESVVHSVRCCPHTPGSYRGLQPMDGGVAHATMPLPFTHNGYGRCRGLGEKPAFGPSSQGTLGNSCGHRES